MSEPLGKKMHAGCWGNMLCSPAPLTQAAGESPVSVSSGEDDGQREQMTSAESDDGGALGSCGLVLGAS